MRRFHRSTLFYRACLAALAGKVPNAQAHAMLADCLGELCLTWIIECGCYDESKPFRTQQQQVINFLLHQQEVPLKHNRAILHLISHIRICVAGKTLHRSVQRGKYHAAATLKRASQTNPKQEVNKEEVTLSKVTLTKIFFFSTKTTLTKTSAQYSSPKKEQ
jgi:hypothetical protein